MQKSVLKLTAYADSQLPNSYRTVFTTKHGRKVCLTLSINGNSCTINNCYYYDRNQNRTGLERYRSKPLKLRSFEFSLDKLLTIIEQELDKKFYDIQFIKDKTYDVPLEGYIRAKSTESFTKYRFLVLVGEGESYNGLPMRLRTRLKNQLHRSIYIDLAYYKDGKGVVKQCCYYDRQYKRQNITITPPMLISCFFPYTKEGILNLINHEICCNFSHIIITRDIDIDSNLMPLCGAI